MRTHRAAITSNVFCGHPPKRACYFILPSHVALAPDLPCLSSSAISMFPWGLGGNDCVETGDDFAHDSGDHGVARISAFRQALRVVSEHWVVGDSCGSRHVKFCSQHAAPRTCVRLAGNRASARD